MVSYKALNTTQKINQSEIAANIELYYNLIETL